jgi:hypothetical protein
MSLYIQQLAKMISNQLGRLYRHFGANSDYVVDFTIITTVNWCSQILTGIWLVFVGLLKVNLIIE